MLEKKLIVRLTGGLGNQMFIYSAAKALSIKSKRKLILDLGDFNYDYKYKRKYELYPFKINDEFANKFESMKPFRRLRTKIVRYQNSFVQFKNRGFIERKQIEYDPDFLKINNDKKTLILSGVWQSYKYFEEINSQIKDIFTLKEEYKNEFEFVNLLNQICKKNSVAIHFRYFSKYESKENLNFNYFIKAIEELEMYHDDVEYFLFSEDPDYSLKKIRRYTNKKINIVSNLFIPAQIVYLMSKCKSHIISNSTFSWWGAWLSQNESKTIICPKLIKLEGESFWGFKGLIPEGWHQI